MLCRTARDTVFRRGYYNREIWKPAIQTAGLLADTTFHDLRHLVPEASARARTALDGAFAAARARAADAPPAGACATDVQRTPACDHEAQVRRRKGVSRPVGRVLCPRLRGATVIHLGLPLPTASCGLPASIGRAALKHSRRPSA
jgi:hypothetical protein